MKAPKKGLATGLLAMAMVTCPVSAWGGVLPVCASETSTGVTATEITGTTETENYSEEGKQDCEITVTVGGEFTVTIPKKIILSGMDGTCTYDVTVEGSICTDDKIKVVPDSSFLLKATGKADTVTTVSQSKKTFNWEDVGAVDEAGTVIGTTAQGNVTAEELSAGNWTGTFNFNITFKQGLDAGLYDADGNMLCTWEESGIDVEKDYVSSPNSAENYYETCTTSPYYVLTNNYPTATKVVIPKGVTSIGERAFYYCRSLTSIDIPDGVTSIGDRAFFYCSNLTSIDIPYGVNSIGTNTFYRCTSLTSIDIPDSVTSIREYAFSNCSSLTSIVIPDSVTSIGKSAFGGCNNLVSISIGSGLTSFPVGAFGKLERITVDADNLYLCSVDNILFDKNRTTLLFYAKGKPDTTYSIPDGVTSIGEYAFSTCKNLTSVAIPDSVTSIGMYAFNFCNNLTSITIGSGVAYIGKNAFLDCTNLASAVFKNPNGWYATNSSNKTAISSSTLSDPASASAYFKSNAYTNVSLTRE